MGYIVYNRLFRRIIVSCNFQLYTIVVMSFSSRSRSLPQKKFANYHHKPKAPAKLIFINPNLQFFKKKRSKLQKKSMQKMVLFHHLFSLFRFFSTTTTTTTPPNIFLKKKVEPSCRRRVLIWVQVLQGFVRFFFRTWGSGNFRYIGNTWRIGPHWVSG